MSLNCKHIVWVEDDSIWLSNDDDSYYAQCYRRKEDIDAFICELISARKKVFNDANIHASQLDY